MREAGSEGFTECEAADTIACRVAVTGPDAETYMDACIHRTRTGCLGIEDPGPPGLLSGAPLWPLSDTFAVCSCA